MSQSDFSVSFEARPEWVAMVRRGVETLLGGDADGRLVGDVKAGVTEACMNAVRHAYPDHTGRVEVRAWLESQRLRVSVRDFGQGLIPSDPGRTGPGFGMPLMEELSSGVEIFSEPGQGTEVVLQFDLPGGGQQGRGPEPTPLLTALPA